METHLFWGFYCFGRPSSQVVWRMVGTVAYIETQNAPDRPSLWFTNAWSWEKIELEGKLKEADEVRADRLAESELAMIKAAKRRKEPEEIGDEAVVEQIDEQRDQETHSENFDPAETLQSLDSREVSVIRAFGRVKAEVRTFSLTESAEAIFLH